MQATTSTHRFGFNRATGSLAAVGIAVAFVAGIVGGVVGQAALDDTESSTGASAPQAVVRPMAYDNPGQGEGSLANTSADSVRIETRQSEGMGEGWLAHGHPTAPEYVEQSNWRLMEMNELPSTLAPARVSREEQLFLELNDLQEMNELPGDDAQLIAPEVVPGTSS